MADATGAGSGAVAIRSRTAALTRAIGARSSAPSSSILACSEPPGSRASRDAVNAPDVTTNPGGTATPIRASEPRLAPFPPTSAAEAADASGTT